MKITLTQNTIIDDEPPIRQFLKVLFNRTKTSIPHLQKGDIVMLFEHELTNYYHVIRLRDGNYGNRFELSKTIVHESKLQPFSKHEGFSITY